METNEPVKTFKSFDADASVRRNDILLWSAEKGYKDDEGAVINPFAVGSAEFSAVLFFNSEARDAYNVRRIGEI